MQPGISSYVFFQHRLHPGLLDALYSTGARTIEIACARHHFDYTEPQAIRETANWFRSNDVRAVLHQPIYTTDIARAVSHLEPAEWSRHIAPNLNLISERKSARVAAMDEVKRALECAEQIPFAAVVLQLGLKDTPWNEAELEYSLTAIEHLNAFAGPLGLRLLVENLQSEAATPEHLLYILRTGHFDNIGVSLDVAHLHLAQPGEGGPADSGVGEAVELLGSRIAQVHMDDNHGPFAHSIDMKDEHLWPGQGTIDWNAVSAALAGLPDSTPGILAPVSGRDEPVDSVVRKAAEFFAEQERRAELRAR